MMSDRKMVVLTDVFTMAQLTRAIQIFESHRGEASDSALVEELEREIMRPNIAQINQRTGQENDTRYWAYAVIHACREAERRSRNKG